MTSTAIRKRLITYLSDAEDNKIKAIYTLLENEIENEKSFVLTKDHLEILDKERELHLNGVTDSYSKQDALDIIKGIKVL
ncbi:MULTISPECIES: hypothetical protein [unclassified Pedobacter]|uniref:hypothetical protein n=1 Tax=Pedobacter TaxID=84567 RepID=UPI000B4B0BCD|nr:MULTISPECIES: hypothetical protein [unclassified Pedobacter]MCX2432058.1 hypothetical protein [Pedobacter sp. GR22-10]OWK71534.1 hypothetical protein CBW18_10835 [Pedobacter sp. AJM]